MKNSDTQKPSESYINIVKKGIRTRFIAGLLVVIPLFITLYIINLINNLFLPFVENVIYFKYLIKEYPLLRNIIGIILGAIVTFGIIYIAGIFATNILGKKIISLGEKIITRIPFIKTVYTLTKQVIESITISSKQSFKRVVWLDYPKKGTKVLGFVTRDLTDVKTGEKLISIFVPTTPNPTSGFMVVIQENEAIDSGLTVEEAMKIIISGGLLLSKKFSMTQTTLSSVKDQVKVEDSKDVNTAN